MLFGKTSNRHDTQFCDARTYDVSKVPAQALSSAWILFLCVCVTLWPYGALAAGDDLTATTATTLGDLICNIKANGLGGYVTVLSTAAYVIGAFLLLRSGILMRRYADNPSQGTAMTPIAHALAGGFITSLPGFSSVVVNSIFAGGGGSGGSSACDPGEVTTVSAGIGIDVMMSNFVENIRQPIIILISVIAFVAGAMFLIQALLRGAKSGSDPRAADPKLIISNLVFGALLMALATTLPNTLKTLFGDDSISNISATTSIIQWSSITGSGGDTAAADNAIAAVLRFVQIIGVISFFRGWLLLKKAVEGGQATIPQGLTHIIAGAMCINIGKMIAIIDDTFGTDIVV
ncbi:MAG: hypothetical protein AB7S81_01885 [Bdellovibrionales bacterium]